MTAKKSPPARRAKRRRPTHAQPPIERLLAIMAKLRDPTAGCPWDREQSFASIAPYTIEEAYEVAEAAERNAMLELKEELGDLLLQVAFHARMAEEIGEFDFDDVAAAVADKMVRRHPHVFGTARIGSAAAQTVAWEDQKAHERRAKSAGQGRRASVLDGVGTALPALTRAAKLQRRAARIGFDWPDVAPIYNKIAEEITELKAESGNRSRSEDELGDLLFSRRSTWRGDSRSIPSVRCAAPAASSRAGFAKSRNASPPAASIRLMPASTPSRPNGRPSKRRNIEAAAKKY